jgi:hypothetical protein
MQVGRDCCGSRFRFSQDEGVASVRNVGTAAADRAAHHWAGDGPLRHPMAAGQGPAVLDDGAVAMGYQYRSSAVVGATDPDPRPRPPVALTGQPGSRAPTCRSPLTTTRSLPCTCTAAALVLLAGVDGTGWMAAAASLKVPVDAYRFGVELTPPTRRPPMASGQGSAAGPARRLLPGAAAAGPPTTTELGGVLRAILSTPR